MPGKRFVSTRDPHRRRGVMGGGRVDDHSAPSCRLQPDDLALFFEDSHWERICRSDFVAANRQSVRESIGPG